MNLEHWNRSQKIGRIREGFHADQGELESPEGLHQLSLHEDKKHLVPWVKLFPSCMVLVGHERGNGLGAAHYITATEVLK
jgi:hypothetical protein